MPTPYAAVQDLFSGDGYFYITDANGSLTPGTFQSLNLLQSGVANNLDLEGYPNHIGNKGVLARILNQNSLSPYAARPYRIFLDPDPGASSTSLAGAAEVTDLLSLHGLESPPMIVDAVVSSHTVTETRLASVQTLRIDGVTSSGSANRVTSIVYEGWQAGDILILTGQTGAVPPIIVRDPGVIDITAPELTLTDDAGSLWLRLGPSGEFLQGFTWPAAADLRTEGLAIPAQQGVFQLTPSAGTATITPGSTGVSAFPGIVYEQDITLIGAPVVLGASLGFAIDATNAVEGDFGYIYGNARQITVGANSVTFSDASGIVATLTAELALSGQWAARWQYLGVISGIERCAWVIIPNFSSTASQYLITSMLKDGNVTNVKLASGIDGVKLLANSVPETALSPTAQAKLNALNFSNVVSIANIIAADRQALWMDCTAGALVVTLPAAGSGAPFMEVRVSKTDASVNGITVSGNGNTINGAATDTSVAAQYDQTTFTWNGAEWFAK